MKSDGGMLWYLLNKIRGGGASNDRGNTPAFGFDGTDDYISSNATIGRTGYDMNVAGNVSTGSDGDGTYIQMNGNRDATAVTGTVAILDGSTTPVFDQTTSFTIKCKFKFSAFPVANASGLFGSVQDATLYLGPSSIGYGLRGSSTTSDSIAASINTLYDLYMVYDASVAKFYGYLSTSGGSVVLDNAGGTAGPTTFSTNDRYVGDNAILSGNANSNNKYIYHACAWNRALTQAEINTDVALGNIAKTDPTIVAYYIPENLQYNTQYMLNPKGFGGTSWSVKSNASVTADTTVAPDGTTTADTYTILAAGTQITNAVEQTSSVLSGSNLASKTFIVKAFVKVAAGTAGFRLKCTHSGVADYYSANQTATVDRQEFTFTQAFTSSTSGTGIICGLTSDTGNNAAVLQVRNVRVYLVNETLRDESPNIGGYLGRKTNKVFSCWCKPGADGTASSQSQTLFYGAWGSFYISGSTNIPTKSIVTRLGAKAHTATALGNGYRSKVHVIGTISYTGGVFAQKIYVNGVLSGSSTGSNDVPTSLFASGIINVGVNTGVYYTGNIRDARIYTFTGSFTNADALAIYNGGEPTSPGVTKYLHYKPLSGEIGTATSDLSGNLRDGTLNGGVTRVVV